MRRFGLLLLAALLMGPTTLALAQQPDHMMSGEISGADNQTYKAIPFDVPAGVERVTVKLTYDKSDKTVVDLGVWDSERFRGWSGGTRDRFTLSQTDASPGYLPGTLPAGRWHVQFGIPNARPDSHSAYTLEVFFDRGERHAASEEIAEPPLKAQAGWYRGDLHMHGAHSDGSCVAQSGKRVPCPLYRTVTGAAERHLDFIAVTDHNTTSHFNGLRELQPAFDQLLLIPGIEITTFRGHANIFGVRQWIDFRVGSPLVPTMAAVEAKVAQAGAILSINHPALPSGEICMGCGWTWPDTDWTKVSAIEVVNGLFADGPLSGLPFWYDLLNKGHRLTGIGGSDNHDPLAGPDKARIGQPTTVVHANELSLVGVMTGIRSGNVFIDVDGSSDRLLEVSASAGRARATMGETLAAKGAVTVLARIRGVPNGKVRLIVNGKQVKSTNLADTAGDQQVTLGRITPDDCGWVSANVFSSHEKLVLVGNPIYLRCDPRRAR